MYGLNQPLIPSTPNLSCQCTLRQLSGLAWNWFRKRTADSVVNRLTSRVRAGDIVVMHDGDEKAPFADQRHTVDATARLIPDLRARGFEFGTICD